MGALEPMHAPNRAEYEYVVASRRVASLCLNYYYYCWYRPSFMLNSKHFSDERLFIWSTIRCDNQNICRFINYGKNNVNSLIFQLYKMKGSHGIRQLFDRKRFVIWNTVVRCVKRPSLLVFLRKFSIFFLFFLRRPRKLVLIIVNNICLCRTHTDRQCYCHHPDMVQDF